MVRGHLSLDLLSVFFRFPVQVLVAASFSPRGHDFHPEVVRIGAQGVQGLLEAHLDLEAISIEAEEVERVQRGQGA